MKVFISWSGDLSRRYAEAIHEWLSSALQNVKPYFTPEDLKKGSRWSEAIASELGSSQFGIICLTRYNLHSDWILFEAGALSKSMDVAHVCPILFGINNADLAGPLSQFQTTQFEEDDFFKLFCLINKKLNDHALLDGALKKVFSKWWPDLKIAIEKIQENYSIPEGVVRSDRELLEEILLILRNNNSIAPKIKKYFNPYSGVSVADALRNLSSEKYVAALDDIGDQKLIYDYFRLLGECDRQIEENQKKQTEEMTKMLDDRNRDL